MPSDRSLESSHSFLPYPSYASRSSSSFQPHQSRAAVASSSYITPSAFTPPHSSPPDPTENNSAPPQIQINGLPTAHAVQQQPLANANAAIEQPSFSPQSAQFYPVPSESVNHDYSIGMQHHPSYYTHHPLLRHPQFEQVLQPETQPTLPSFTSQQISPANQRSLCQQNIGNGMFYQARDFVIKDSVLIDSSSDNFMTSFLKETIRGAEFDSSDPNMPLRCHPGTRLKIIKRCQDFVLTCNGPKKLRWVVGAAGVGKSVIMQSVARDESRVLSNIIMGATIFFSVDGRKYGTKAIATIAYQLAVKLNPYRLFVQRELTRDPSLLRKSLSTQFNKFIVEPFVYHQLLPPSSRLLIIIDGLDECANPLTQRELLDLLSFFCITYPSSPIVWIVASRPEPHITSFFSQPKVTTTYEKEEILVDSEEAHEDVKCYLRDKLREIQMTSLVLQHLPQWPSDDNLFKIANASSGLFAYASTVVRYISDPTYGDPVGQLDDVLEFIEAGTKSNLSGQDHPMAQLDALYGHIMSKIPAEIMANTRKLLLVYAVGSDLDFEYFHFNCNMLGMTENDAYGATHHIRSIAIVPEPAEAAKKPLGFFHKSFLDYLQDFERSGFSRNILFEAEQLRDQLAHRILEQAPDGVYLDGASKWDLNLGQGILKNCSGTQDKIAVSWPAVGEDNDCEMRFDIFRMAVSLLTRGLGDNSESLRSLLCMHVLTTCFTKLREYFPLDAVRDFPFDDFRRHEFMEHGILKQVSLQTIDYDAIMISRYIRLHFKGPTDNTWNESCRHAKKGDSRDWSTRFKYPEASESKYPCSYCFERFAHHFKTQSPDHLVTVLDLTTGHRVVELRFVDPGDGVSEWTYHFITGKEIMYMEGDDEGSDGEYNDESYENESDEYIGDDNESEVEESGED